MGEQNAESGTLRVLVADDSVLLREGLVRLLEEGGCEVVGPFLQHGADACVVVEHHCQAHGNDGPGASHCLDDPMMGPRTVVQPAEVFEIPP